jgi:hypothetical protein
MYVNGIFFSSIANNFFIEFFSSSTALALLSILRITEVFISRHLGPVIPTSAINIEF